MKKPALTILLLLAATTVRAGTLWTEYFDCTPIYKLFALSWKGPWSFETRKLESGPTNHGPWVVAVSDALESGCLVPATNLSWYRMRGCTLPLLCVTDSNVLWVPQTLCAGNPHSEGEVRT